MRALLGLDPPAAVGRLEVPLAVAAIAGLLGLAAAQPVLRTDRPQLARRDAQALVAIDISRSMLAAASATARTRIDRARAVADDLRARLADIPAGVATFTDRPLPLLFPTPNASAFTSTVAKAVGIERPPPRGTALTVTTYDALTPIPGAGYFTPGIRAPAARCRHRRGERGLRRRRAPPELRRPAAHRRRPRPRRHHRERVFGPDGLAEPGYAPPAASAQALAQFLAVTHGRAFGEHELGQAAQAARAALGNGPRARLGAVAGRRDLAPYLVLAAALPLGLVLRRRNL